MSPGGPNLALVIATNVSIFVLVIVTIILTIIFIVVGLYYKKKIGLPHTSMHPSKILYMRQYR